MMETDIRHFGMNDIEMQENANSKQGGALCDK